MWSGRLAPLMRQTHFDTFRRRYPKAKDILFIPIDGRHLDAFPLYVTAWILYRGSASSPIPVMRTSPLVVSFLLIPLITPSFVLLYNLIVQYVRLDRWKVRQRSFRWDVTATGTNSCLANTGGNFRLDTRSVVSVREEKGEPARGNNSPSYHTYLNVSQPRNSNSLTSKTYDQRYEQPKGSAWKSVSTLC